MLLVEDEALFARAVSKRLTHAGYECAQVANLADARAKATQFLPDVVLLDMRLPDGSGFDLLPDLVAKGVAVIAMTAFGEISDAVSAIKQGAADYLKKPVDLEELLLAVEKAQRASRLRHQLDYSRERDSHVAEGVNLLGESPAMQEARAQIERLARLTALTDVIPPTVLICGETGTGKDVAARLLHLASARQERPFVQVDCAALPAELIENELFGHEKGAFTNAQASRPGLIEAAEDGSLFLDEIGELPLALQAKLLNVLERRVVRRLGSTRERPVYARFIAATNRDLQQMVLDGQFRADLYYRLNVLGVTMPPLRQRGEDSLLLARHFAAQTARRYGLPLPGFTATALDALRHYSWPGNVRELKHLINRSVLLCHGQQISAEELALPAMSSALLRSSTESGPLQTLEQAEKSMIEHALKQAQGNVSEAARLLGITRMTIRYRMDKYGIKLAE